MPEETFRLGVEIVLEQKIFTFSLLGVGLSSVPEAMDRR